MGTDETKLQRYTQAQIFMARVTSAKKKVKRGDQLTVWTLKGGSTEACNNRTEVHRKAKEIAVYPHFVHTRLLSPYPGRTGCEESFRWDDIVKWNKYLWEDTYSRDAGVRSKTFPGIAKAMAEQWGGKT